MELLIDNNHKICDIQYEFSKHFPFLKLEFFDFIPGERKVFSNRRLINDTQKTVEQIRVPHYPGHISINGHQKVSTLEYCFKEDFGLYVQVFRKSGNAWLQTTTTDDWTLTEQNKKGEEMSDPILEEITSDFDYYHEQS